MENYSAKNEQTTKPLQFNATNLCIKILAQHKHENIPLDKRRYLTIPNILVNAAGWMIDNDDGDQMDTNRGSSWQV